MGNPVDIKLAETVIEFLNALTEVDLKAVEALMERRVPCNDDMANHPTVQVADNRVGILGLLNGLCGVHDDGWGPVAAVYEEPSGALLRFELTKGHD